MTTAAVRREVAFEDHQAAGRLDRVRRAAARLAARSLDRVARVVADGPACHGDGVSLEDAGVGQTLHDERDAACTMQVGRDVRPPGFRSASSGDLRADAIEIVDVQRHARFVGDREQMQDRVGRTAGRRNGGDGILDRGARDDLARPEAAAEHVDDQRARGCRARPRLVDVGGRHAARCRKAKCRASRRRWPWCSR